MKKYRKAVIKNLLLFAAAALILAFNACQKQCTKVTGPNDISYNSVSPPDCTTGTFTVNSLADFDVYCPGGTTPTSWDFINKTYFIIDEYIGGTGAYLAGVGNDPSNSNNIIVTLGQPCSKSGAVPAMAEQILLGIEVAKTTKNFTVDIKQEPYNYELR